ncbi:hypothetical protein AADW59_00280 [Candidatus Hodgkinia cicadicola]
MFEFTQTLIIAAAFGIILLLCYLWAYWHYYYVSKNKQHNILYSLTGGEWPPANIKPKEKITIALYKTIILMLTNVALNNKSTGYQIGLTLLLLITQLVELRDSASLKRTVLIYHTCAISILVIIILFTLVGLVISILQATYNSSSLKSKRINSIHYWYWKCFMLTWGAMYIAIFK